MSDRPDSPLMAAEVLAAECGHPAWCCKIEGPADKPDGWHLVAALLSHGIEGVAVLASGEVLALEPLTPGESCRCAHDHWSACTTGQGCPCLTSPLYRLVTPTEVP